MSMIKKGEEFLTGKVIGLAFFPFLFFSYTAPAAATHNFTPGSRSAAMGNASVTISDLWSVHHNQAGLAFLTAVQAGFHYENRYFMPELGYQALALALPASPGTFGLTYTFFGFSGYNESRAGFAFGRTLGEWISAGVRINYLHTFLEGYSRIPGRVTAEGGIIVKPGGGLLIAAHLYNPARIGRPVEYHDPLPVIVRAGVSAMAGENILIALEAEKESGYNTLLKSGIEMGFAGPFYLRTGFSLRPVQPSFGFGYAAGSFAADIAFTNHQVLGFSPHITIVYARGGPR
jgi:hypothetical protein